MERIGIASRGAEAPALRLWVRVPDRIEERVEVRFARAEIHDARAKHEPPVQLGARQKDVPGVLDRLEDAPIKTIDVGLGWRRVGEWLRTGGPQLHVPQQQGRRCARQGA